MKTIMMYISTIEKKPEKKLRTEHAYNTKP